MLTAAQQIIYPIISDILSVKQSINIVPLTLHLFVTDKYE